MTARTRLNEIDKVEILTLQDNYIDLTAMDNNKIIQRALPFKDGQIRKSILSNTVFPPWYGQQQGTKHILSCSIRDSLKSGLFIM